jgi:superfamily II DNA or RNA helicase
LRFCRDTNIKYSFNEERRKKESTSFRFNAELRDYQKDAINAISKKDMGVIVAPPGSGKTIIGLKIIAEKQQPALIVVHRKQLMEQWIERVETFLGIPAKDIGVIRKGKSKTGRQITIATIQTLIKELTSQNNEEIKNAFGMIIIDECHHIPAETYWNAIQQMNSYYLYGLTATPFRKYNDGKLIFIHLGEIISEITPQQTGRHKEATIIIRNTELDVPFNLKTDRFETLSNILIHDSTRNKFILEDITKELDSGNRVVIITERKEHIESLHQYLKQSYETISLSGEDSEINRSAKWKILKSGDYQALITTGQFFGEGTDLQNANCLFLVYPFSFEGKLIQYIGRVQRSELTPTIYDYRDIKIDYLNKLFLKRNTYYRKLERQTSLFEDPIEAPTKISGLITIQKEIKVNIESLDFRYGSVAFTYIDDQTNHAIEFEIGNENIRPEFEVLKPYFAKALKSKLISITIYAEIEKDQLVSQLASSSDLDRINREVVEGVRFRFVAKHFLGKLSPVTADESSEVNQMQSDHSLYESGEELLEDILKQIKFKHHKQLRWLAENHTSHLLKVRFVLYPFSFVFLLEGEQQFHIILETLDTEEASYLWHFDKDIDVLSSQLKEIDKQLDLIRRKGRQVFLLSPPLNFSRIIHDYTDNQKGFIIWRDELQERLV